MEIRENINITFSYLHASPDTLSEVMKMISENTSKSRINLRFVIIAALAVCMMLALCVSAYAAFSFMSWGNNAKISVNKTASGVIAETELYTDDLTDPVQVVDGRLIFIVNGESLDITDRVSHGKAYVYEYADGQGIKHTIIVGLNGHELDNYGYAEFMHDGSAWIGGYSVRTNLDENGRGPAWLESAKSELGIPW